MTMTNEIREKIEKKAKRYDDKEERWYVPLEDVLKNLPLDHVLVKEKDLLTEEAFLEKALERLRGYACGYHKQLEKMLLNRKRKLKALNKTKLELKRSNYKFPKKIVTSNYDTILTAINEGAKLATVSMLKNEVLQARKEERQKLKKMVEKWVDECDADGRGIMFTFTDSDKRELLKIFEGNCREK